MRHSPFHSLFSRLGLLAILLLALLPSVGRMTQSAPLPASPSIINAALCTVEGLVTRAIPALPVVSDAHATDHAPPPLHGEDCAYCPLLTALVTFVALVLATLFLHSTHPLQWPPQSAPRRWHPTGLGSRGPPLSA